MTDTIKCPSCGMGEWTLAHNDGVRLGRFPNMTNGDIFACVGCGLKRLQAAPIDYSSPEYRQLVDDDPSIDHFYELHDSEILQRLGFVDLATVRGKIVADVGCGGGSALDAVQGLASETIAIEPATQFQEELRAKGHRVFPFATDALPDWEGRVDVVMCFAVIEHIEDPALFVQEIRRLLKPGGRLILSTPNDDDWLVEFLPGVFDRFFYRYVHRWYFNGSNIAKLLERAGFGPVEVKFHHTYDISNALMWIRDGRPTGTGKFPLLERLDGSYRQLLCEQGRSDTLVAVAKRL